MFKRILLATVLAVMALQLNAQSCYWVFFSDKQGSTFDPYAYFDVKAIDRYRATGADLYHISNYPLSQSYVDQVSALATAEIGQTRWFNAMAVMATPDQLSSIAALPFVSDVQLIATDMQMAAYRNVPSAYAGTASIDDDIHRIHDSLVLSDQLVRMQGKLFATRGFTGRGIRIAVFDGGFPAVDTHKAFAHLRYNNQIIKTWNFCNNKENVYGWNSHGTMTLSCIAGLLDGFQMGLAQGAEFLLARTEVETEPFKEEVWWMQAVEWADKNGAQIISSSLGYGKERYYTTDMNGTSYVAKAANMAARKGMLVCNSAGNEGTDRQWKTIITPADADSVLCIGGISASLDEYRHIDFSSYGPSADGRQKPNVCAFGQAWAASPKTDSSRESVFGTSFSCPLVAGFAACAWQSRPYLTNMELFRQIQESADLYPYHDYVFGYGVPQASYFTTNTQHQKAAGKFRFVESEAGVAIELLDIDYKAPIFFNVARDKDSLIEYYYNLELIPMRAAEGNPSILIDKDRLFCRTLNVHYLGQTQSFHLSDAETRRLVENGYNDEFKFTTSNIEKYLFPLQRDLSDNKPSRWGSNAKYRADVYLQFGDMLPLGGPNVNPNVKAFSPAFHFGGRLMRGFGKSYALGLGLELANTRYNLDNTRTQLDNLVNAPVYNVKKKRFNVYDVSFEFFQRVRFVAGGLMGKGLHWDLGCYVSFTDNYLYAVEMNSKAPYEQSTYTNPDFIDAYPVNWGLATRLGYDWWALYVRCRATRFATSYDVDPSNPRSFQFHLPRFEAGVEIKF